MTRPGATAFRPLAVFRKAYREASWALFGVAIDDAFRAVRPGHQPPSGRLLESGLVRAEPMLPVIATSQAAAFRIALLAAIDAWPEHWKGPPDLPTWSLVVADLESHPGGGDVPGA